jgi:post-segregation antitoxin (ccd killing protein)
MKKVSADRVESYTSKIDNSSSSEEQPIPRGKSHTKSKLKTTVGVYLPRDWVEKAKNKGLNLSRVTEQALSSILDYMDTQNIKMNSETSPVFLSPGSFLKESGVPRAGFEPATTRSSAERSPRLSYLGGELPHEK